jgi:hypothetical protein
MPSPETARENGKLGGRPKGSRTMHPSVFQARKRAEQAKISLQEYARNIEIDMIRVLEEIARDKKQPGHA